MKKYFKLLFITVLLLHPLQVMAALSLEALEIVETMRRNLSQISAQKEADLPVPSSESYVVGSQLQQALAKMRSQIYGQAIEASPIPSLKDHSEKIARAVDEVEIPELYIPGSALRIALDKIRSTRDPGEICIDELKKDFKTAAKDEAAVAEPAVESATPVESKPLQEPVDKAEPVSEPQATEIEEPAASEESDLPSRLEALKQKYQTDSANEVPAQSEKQDEPAATKKEDTETDDLNLKLKKHEFKMPGSYRIIVR
ncbi:MAG: hypothetical protein ACOYXC_17430 [Candidatus Rifleibacteriota bacterium]